MRIVTNKGEICPPGDMETWETAKSGLNGSRKTVVYSW